MARRLEISGYSPGREIHLDKESIIAWLVRE